MADISMCLNHECPLKDRCYRYIAPVNEHWQSYMDFKYDFEKKECNDKIEL